MPHPAGQETFVGWVFLLLRTGLGCIAIVGPCCAVVMIMLCSCSLCGHGLCGHGLCSHGLYGHGLCGRGTFLLIAWIEFE